MSKSIHQIIKENIESDNIANLRKLDEQGWFQDLYTKRNLEHAAKVGAVEATKLIATYHRTPHDHKVDAMFAAARAHQVETVKTLADAGVSYGYAIGSLVNDEANRGMFQAIVDTGYHPDPSDMHFFRIAGKDIVLDALVERNHKDQEIYKQAFYSFIGNAEATDGMDEQKAMLKASATGTATDIDFFIANKQTAENEFWLKNLDVALHFGNDATAQALIKHGAEIKPEYVQVAEKYTSESTVEAVKAAQFKQMQQQTQEQSNKPQKPARTRKKAQGLSL